MKFNKIMGLMLTLLIGMSNIAVARGGGGGFGGRGGGGGFGGGGGHAMSVGRGSGGFSGGGGFASRGSFSSGASMGRSSGFSNVHSASVGYRGPATSHMGTATSSFGGTRFAGKPVSGVGTGRIGTTAGRQISPGRTGMAGTRHVSPGRGPQTGTGKTGLAGKQTGLAGKQAGLGKGAAGRQPGAGKAATGQGKLNQANKASGLNKGNINKGTLGKAQQAAKGKFANNPKLAGINKHNAKNLVNNKGWNFWHNGFLGWNPLWWGAGFGLLGFAWNWGWNWWWGNGVWWWGGYPWYWWHDYDPVYFADVVYPQYVAQYEGVSGDEVAYYWDITNATDSAITVNAEHGETGIAIESGDTKRVFHDPGYNKFTADTSAGAIQYDTPDKEVTVDAAPAAEEIAIAK